MSPAEKRQASLAFLQHTLGDRARRTPSAKRILIGGTAMKIFRLIKRFFALIERRCEEQDALSQEEKDKKKEDEDAVVVLHMMGMF